MKCIVHDTLSLLEPLFCHAHKPKDRLELAQPILFADDSLIHGRRLLPRAMQTQSFKVMQAGAVDGYSVVAAQQGWGLFNPARSVASSQWLFAEYARLDILRQLEHYLHEAMRGLEPSLKNYTDNDDTLELFLFPADPANRQLMLRSHGLSIFAAIPQVIMVQLWADASNMARLPILLARALRHNLAVQRAQPHMLADFLALEDVVSMQALLEPVAWQDTLQHAAELCDASNYDDVTANIYGADGSSILPLPQPEALDAEMLEYAQLLLAEGGQESQPERIAAYLYGDAVVSSQGHAGVGMPALTSFLIFH